MPTISMTPLRWAIFFFASWLLLPVVPAALVMLLGFTVPGIIPWSLVEASFPAAAVASFIACLLLLLRGPGPAALRFLAAVVVTVVLGFIARTEVVMQAECGPPRGKYIDFQRQNQESKLQEVSCE